MSKLLDDQLKKDLASLKSFTIPPPHSASPETKRSGTGGPPTSAFVDPHLISTTEISPGIAVSVSTPKRLVFGSKSFRPPPCKEPQSQRPHADGMTSRSENSPPLSVDSGSIVTTAQSTKVQEVKPKRAVSPMARGGSSNRSNTPSGVYRTPQGAPGTPNRTVKKPAAPNALSTSSTMGPPPGVSNARAVKRNPSELEVAKSEAEFLRQSLCAAEDRAQEDLALIRNLEEERINLEGQISHAQRQIVNLETDFREKESELQKERLAKDAAMREITQRDLTIAQLQKKLQVSEDETKATAQSADVRIATITEAANARMLEFESYISNLTAREKQLNQEVAMSDNRITTLEALLTSRESEYKDVLLRGEMQRSELHNRIQEMKGNIRVYARVRPLIPHDREYRKTRTISNYAFPDKVDHRTLTVAIPGPPAKDYTFEFDKVFEPCDDQDRIFEEISQLVQSALDGYKVCIFVYGQTGSGKTFTMEGDSAGQTGIIQRAVELIFHHSQQKRKTGWTYTLRASFVEIYNETFHDLLNPNEFCRGPGGAAPKHEIRTVEEESFITNVEEVEVKDASTVHHLLDVSQRNRKCEFTMMNDRASRSHSVFTLKIKGMNEGTAQILQGVLNLVDLAGSERIAKSAVEGERLRETQAINKSLSSLGDVIAALAKGDASHVPFRNSKLTHMLQPYMGGQSKTLMFVNISPAEAHVNESLCSLRFASKVNACEIGLAMRKVSSVVPGQLERSEEEPSRSVSSSQVRRGKR